VPQAPYPWLKPAVFAGALVPLAALAIRGAQGGLTADPVAYVLNQFGLLTLIFLIASLALTPIRALTGWPWPIRIRRMVGVFAFFYGSLHLLTYVAVDQGFDAGAIWKDLTKRKFIYVGFTAFLLLVPLAVTSTNRMVRRLGFARWQKLHRIAYLAGALGVLHFIWRVKRDLTVPLIYAGVVAALMLFRLVRSARGRAAAGPPSLFGLSANAGVVRSGPRDETLRHD